MKEFNAEKAIKTMYAEAGLKEPKIVWCTSPLAMALTRYFVQEVFKNKKLCQDRWRPIILHRPS